MNLSPERFQEMCVQNDARLQCLYWMRSILNGEIEFRERLQRDWASTASQDRATEAPPQAPTGLGHAVGIADAGGGA